MIAVHGVHWIRSSDRRWQWPEHRLFGGAVHRDSDEQTADDMLVNDDFPAYRATRPRQIGRSMNVVHERRHGE